MTRIKVKVTPAARKESLEKISDGEFRVSVKELAERNEANNRVRELLAEHFAVPLGKVRMLAGHRSRTKRFEITTV